MHKTSVILNVVRIVPQNNVITIQGEYTFERIEFQREIQLWVKYISGKDCNKIQNYLLKYVNQHSSTAVFTCNS